MDVIQNCSSKYNLQIRHCIKEKELFSFTFELFSRGNHRLSALQDVLQFGVRLSELQCALRRDKDTLDVLDTALQDGATVEVASSVRDVARLLSEKQDTDVQVRIFSS